MGSPLSFVLSETAAAEGDSEAPLEAAAEAVSEELVEAAGAADGAAPDAQADKVQVIKRDRNSPAAKILLFIKSPPLNCPAYTGQTVVKL
jgi:hypothetical protein